MCHRRTRSRKLRAAILFLRALMLFATTLFSSANFFSTVTAATRVELVINEPTAKRNVAWPVTTGVPFPRGALTADQNVRLVDDLGRERPLQTKLAAFWDVEKKSIRWLTIDFIAEAGRTYALQFGNDVSRTKFPNMSVNRETLAVETGPLRVLFSRVGPTALQTILVDLDADGRFSQDEAIAAGPQTGDHYFLNQRNERSDNSRDGHDRQIVIETTGPVRTCVRVDGWYTNAAGERLIRCRSRYHLFAGLPVVKVIDEFQIVGSTRETQFRDIGLGLTFKLDATDRQVRCDAPRVPLEKKWDDLTPQQSTEIAAELKVLSVPWSKSTTSISSSQDVYRHFGNLECRAVVTEQHGQVEKNMATGPQAGNWLQVADQRAAITGSLRWFWQQFPKQWEATHDQLTLHLWSPRFEPLDFGERGLRNFLGPAGEKWLLDWKGVRTPQSPIENFFYFAGRHALKRDGADGLGMNKHHEVWWHFGAARHADDGAEYGRLAGEPPLCLATGKWNCATDVFGPLAARPNDSPHEKIVDRIFDLERYAQENFGDYGWWLFGAGPHYSYQWDAATQRHYADPRRFEYHTYQRETQLWWNYLRSGERKFWDWALPAENHWVDIAVAHVPTTFSTEWRGGVAEPANLTWPAGDWSIDSPLHYVRHHDTGEAWLRSASQFWATYHRTLETTTLALFLTGDERFADVIELWRQHWRSLAGVRSDSVNVPPAHREQLWFQPTAAGQPTKTWAEMLRDYAPFQSGSRHQMTLFFNLATLYEQTWDPDIRQVLSEYADAFLDPKHFSGAWRSQDHRPPANADSPKLSHYWAPALWKYSRASNDARMPEILKKYFTAAYHADPFGGNVGVYSNVQIAWGWHFTRDPRHLAAAVHELDELSANANALKRPEELGERIYNPHHPVRALTSTPRLIAALEDAKQQGILPSAPPLTPQRTVIALRPNAEQTRKLTLWGWEQKLRVLDADGKKIADPISVETHTSPLEPFDRVLRNHHVFRSNFSFASGDDWIFLSPQIETGILEQHGIHEILCWAGEPIRVQPKEKWWLQRPSTDELVIESAQPQQIKITVEGQELSGKVIKNRIFASLANISSDARLAIEARGEAAIWFRLPNASAEQGWAARSSPLSGTFPKSIEKFLADRTVTAVVDESQIDSGRTANPEKKTRPVFVDGKFGQGLLLVPGRTLQISDEFVAENGEKKQFSSIHEGTIEFWIKRLWDERITTVPPVPLLSNGEFQTVAPNKLAFNEWTHVAYCWRPSPSDGESILLHVYVDGRDFATYRNLFWAGYSKPPSLRKQKDWLKKFVLSPPPGINYVIDELRISQRAIFFDPTTRLGPQQTFNPFQFQPAEVVFPLRDEKEIYLPFDGDLKIESAGNKSFVAELIREKE